MGQRHASTPAQRAQWVSRMIAQAGEYGAVTALSQAVGVSRQTLNALLAKLGQAGLIDVGFRRIRVLDVDRLADSNAPLIETECAVRQARRTPHQPARAGGSRVD